MRKPEILALICCIIFMIAIHFSVFLQPALAGSSVRNPVLSKPRYVEGELIIKFKDDRFLSVMQSDRRICSMKPIYRHVKQFSRRFDISKKNAVERGLTRIYLIEFEKSVPMESLLKKYTHDTRVEYIQPNYIYEADVVPNDPGYSEQYAHQLTQAEAAWDVSTGSSNIVVAVIGTGVDIDHPDLAANIWTNTGEIPGNNMDDDGNGYIDDVNGWNFYNDNNNPRPSGSSHETMVAGIISAVGNNSEGICGVTWSSKIMPLRVAYTSADVAAAVEYARLNGAHVINMSFGNYTKSKYGDYLVKDMLDDAYESGILAVATAGNDKMDLKRYPAALFNVMAVAATDQNDSSASWQYGHTGTNFGYWVDIAAPGTDISSTLPGSTYGTGNGTSFAAPYIAGVGALLLSHQPSLTNLQVRAILENTPDPVNTEADFFYNGTGRVNAWQSLSTSSTGYPLGEISAPENRELISKDSGQIAIALLASGSFYKIEYTAFGKEQWTLISQGNPDVDTQADGLIHLSLANPGLGAYMMRLTVTNQGYTHVDSKMFGIYGDYQQNWSPDIIGAGYMKSGSICMDIDEDGKNEVIQSANGNYTYIWNDDGTNLPGWPQQLVNDPAYSSSAVGDVDGDGDYEVVTVTNAGGDVYVWHWQNGQLLSGDWPKAFGGYIMGNPLLADLDGDGDSEIIVAFTYTYNASDGIYVFQHDGTTVWSHPLTQVHASMAAADLDGDGDIEIVAQNYDYNYVLDHEGNQVKAWPGSNPASPIIADLDKDGELEIICLSGLHLHARSLSVDSIWQSSNNIYGTWGSTSVGDLDDDGYLEIFVAENGGALFNHMIYGLNHDGTSLTAMSFKRTLGKQNQNAPVIGDINGDGKREMVFCSSAGLLFAWGHDGNNIDTFPRLISTYGSYSSPTLADLDQDGDIEILLGTDDGQFHVWDLPGTYNPDTIDWGMYRHDPQCSGLALRAPKINPVSIPQNLHVGQLLQFQIAAANPDNLPLYFYVRQMPAGASFDPQTRIFTWIPTPDQAGGTYKFYLFLTDRIRQDHQPVSITVLETSGTIIINSPNGGENWSKGSTRSITWTSQGLTGDVTIDLYKGGVYESHIGVTAADSHSFSWNIPVDGTPGNDYRVHIHQGIVEDYSDSTFSITFPPLSPLVKPDFNGDGNDDILWRYYGTGGYNAVWLRGTGASAASNADILSEKKNAPVVDMDNLMGKQGKILDNADMNLSIQELRKQGIIDGFAGFKPDEGVDTTVLYDPFKDESNQRLSRIMASSVTDPRDDPEAVELTASVNIDWKLCGTGDFNADDNVDLVWRNVSNGNNVVWFMDGVTMTDVGWLPATTSLDWTLCGTGDFNADNNVDLVWRNVANGKNVVWYMDGLSRIGIGWLPTSVNLDWSLCGIGDINTDGKPDLVWRNVSIGKNAVWFMDGVTMTDVGWLPTTTNLDWTLCGTGDFNNDGQLDLLWRNAGNGNNAIWYMDGLIQIGVGFVTTVTDTAWKIEN